MNNTESKFWNLGKESRTYKKRFGILNNNYNHHRIKNHTKKEQYMLEQ